MTPSKRWCVTRVTEGVIHPSGQQKGAYTPVQAPFSPPLLYSRSANFNHT
jgi:hypothetical protein